MNPTRTPGKSLNVNEYAENINTFSSNDSVHPQIGYDKTIKRTADVKECWRIRAESLTAIQTSMQYFNRRDCICQRV